MLLTNSWLGNWVVTGLRRVEDLGLSAASFEATAADVATLDVLVVFVFAADSAVVEAAFFALALVATASTGLVSVSDFLVLVVRGLLGAGLSVDLLMSLSPLDFAR